MVVIMNNYICVFKCLGFTKRVKVKAHSINHAKDVCKYKYALQPKLIIGVK